jgi:hypothetical protein
MQPTNQPSNQQPRAETPNPDENIDVVCVQTSNLVLFSKNE